MSNDVSPSLNLPLPALIDLGIEHWRLTGWLTTAGQQADCALARHALRRMEDFLRNCELEIRSLDGQPFDAGMAARVVESVDDPQLGQGKVVVEETLVPLVLWRGTVVRPADVVTRSGTRK